MLLTRHIDSLSTTAPTAIRHYQIVRELGRGGMGVVYEGIDTKLARRVAIKAIGWDQRRDQRRIERFRREAQLLASLDHPNIGVVFSFEETESGHFIILEYVEGSTLEERLRSGPLSIREAISIHRQIARAVSAAHEQGVAHRDLSSNNVMVRNDGQVKVLDFGLARSIGDSRDNIANVRGTGPIQGTPCYMSPETLRGERSRAAADIWAFGCLLFESLSGQRAFDAPTVGQLVQRIIHEPPPLEILPEATPAPLRRLIEQCLAKDVRDRLGELATAVELLDSESVELGGGPAAVRAFVQPLQRVLSKGDPLLLRIYVENQTRRAVDLGVEVLPCDGWKITGGSPAECSLGERCHREIFAVLEADAAGPLRLPEVRLRSHAEERRLLPVPSNVTVRDAVPDGWIGLHGVRREIEGRLGRIGELPGWLSVIQGEPGSGKTHLLEQIDREARRRGYRTLRAFAHSGVGQPLKMMYDLFRGLLGIIEAEHRDETLEEYARTRLQEYLGRQSSNVERFLAVIVGREPDQDDEGMRQLRWYRLLAAAAIQTPCILLIDDIDRGDRSSVALLRSVLARCREDRVPIAAFCTMRPAADGAVPASSSLDLLREAGLLAHTIAIEPLSIAEIDELIAARYEGANHLDYAPGLAARIHARTGGHAGMTREYIEALSSESPGRPGLIQRAGPRWRFRAEASPDALLSELPSLYIDLLERRLEPVSKGSRNVLEIAALLGPEVSIEALERLVPQPDLLDDGLDELESLAILAPVDVDLSRYRFTNPSFSVLVLRQLDRRGSRKAMRLRGRVAAELQDFYAHPRHAEELGLRLVDLMQPRAALPHLLAALARRLLHRQVTEADRLLARIDEIASRFPPTDDRQLFEWLSLSGRVHILSGRLERGSAITRQALRVAERGRDLGAQALCSVRLSELEYRQGNFEAARALADQARLQSSDPALEEIHAQAVNSLAMAVQELGDRTSARDLWESNRLRFIDWSDRAGEAAATHNLGIVHYQEGRFEEAERHFRKTVEIAEELDNLDFAMQAKVWLTNMSFRRGELERARHGYAEAVETFRKLQNRRALSRNYNNLAEAEALLGNLPAACPAAERAAALCREMRDLATEAQYRLSLAQILWLAGRAEEARAELRRAGEGELSIAPGERRRVFLARRALLAERLGDLCPLRTLAAALPLEIGSDADEVGLLEASVVVRGATLAGSALGPAIQSAAESLIGAATGLDTISERVGLAAALARACGESAAGALRRLGPSIAHPALARWLELSLARLLIG